ncbi:hypothetical protein MXB_1305, partial [Myxobolus squamalis]
MFCFCSEHNSEEEIEESKHHLINSNGDWIDLTKFNFLPHIIKYVAMPLLPEGHNLKQIPVFFDKILTDGIEDSNRFNLQQSTVHVSKTVKNNTEQPDFVDSSTLNFTPSYRDFNDVYKNKNEKHQIIHP